MELVNDKHIGLLHKRWVDICTQYAKILCARYDWDFENCFWVSNDIGGVFCTDDIEYSLSMNDIRLLVDNNYPYKDFEEWWAQVIESDEDHPYINLYSWMKGFRPYDKNNN